MRSEAILGELERRGLLLLSDARRPAVAQLVAGEPIAGSWWGHPQGGAIFGAANLLEAHPDVLIAKLVDGKVTFVHRALWPALLGAACERAPWQLDGLSAAAAAALDGVEARGDETAVPTEVARELDLRLLAHVREVHTEKGSHAKRADSWARWAAREGIAPIADRSILERAVLAFGGGKLPWMRKARR